MPLQDHWYVGDDAEATNSNYLNVYGTGANVYSQTVTAESTYDITKVRLRLTKVGSPTGNFTVEVYDCSTDTPATAKPTGSVLATATLATGDITTGDNPYLMTFDSPVTLTSGTMYALVLRCPGGDSSSKCIRPRTDITTILYTGGNIVPQTSTPGTWGTVSTTQDVLFETFSAAEILSVTGSIGGVSGWSGTAGLFEFLHATGEMAGVSVFTGAVTLFEFIHLTGEIAGVGSWAGNLEFVGAANLVWPPLRGKIPADDDTLHNITLVAVGHDSNGLGIIYFKET